jgi:hypothetical protein
MSRRSPIRLALALAFTALGASPAARAADDDVPTLSRALYLEKTSRDPKAALPVFVAVRGDAKATPDDRAEARLGEARCLVALSREGEALDAWRALLADAEAPAAAKEEARARVEDHERAARARAEDEADAKAKEAMRRAEASKADQESRLRSAARHVETAEAHLRARRYDHAREELLAALQLNPDDARASALLEEVGAYLADRGDVLRQAIRFVASSRLSEYRRLVSDVERMREAGRKALREGRPRDAAKTLADAIERIDASDFYADLGDRRAEVLSWFAKALEDGRKKGLELETEVKVPSSRPGESQAPRPWRSEFFALLGRIFATRTDEGTPLRFYDAAVPPDVVPDPAGARFASSGIASSPAPGTLRRARWLERHVRSEVAPGSWTGPDRVLERYDDTLVVQHTATVQAEIARLVRAFDDKTHAPVLLEARLYGAKPGGVPDALRALFATTGPGEPSHAVVVKGRLLAEQVEALAHESRVVLLGSASMLLSRRHSATIRFTEPTSSSPLYADKDAPAIVVPDRDAVYGVDLETYAEDLPGFPGEAAVSVSAVVRRPDRARALQTPSGLVRQPVFLVQSSEADRRVPHSGSLMLLGLANPFRMAATDDGSSSSTYPDLFVLVAARPVARDGTAAAPDLPPPASPAERVVPDERGTREADLGPLGTIVDQPPPEDWPTTPLAAGARPEAAEAAREAFLAGYLRDAAQIGPERGTILVRDGKVTADLLPGDHALLTPQVDALVKDEGRLFGLRVLATEAQADRVATWLRAAGANLTPLSGGRPPPIHVLDAAPAARLEERLAAQGESQSLYALDARLLARHTQLVTAVSVRSRSIVSDFRVEAGRTLPVLGTLDEGAVVTVRPVSYHSGLVMLSVHATLARVEKVEPWKPAGAPGEAPTVDVPRHATEPLGALAAIGENQTLVVVVPAPATDGARVVLVRVRRENESK